MSLSIGIIGLPNVGKSTLFNALTRAGALAANYPFATIEPNTGVVPIPDQRVNRLAELFHSARAVHATVTFVDIAGLVEGANRGEGLGNRFLANIREVDALCHVVRAFASPAVSRIGEVAAPESDITVVETELALADLETIDRRLPRLEREATVDRSLLPGLQVLRRVREVVAAGDLVGRHPDLMASQDLFADLFLLTVKPVIYLFNMDPDGLADTARQEELARLVAPSPALFLDAQLESELVELDPAEQAELLADMGRPERGLDALARVAYDILGLQSFLTVGEKEARAWTIRAGSTAAEAAGVIHSDFQRGFIAAEVADYERLVEAGSWQAARAAGIVRTEGKGYVMRPSDVVEFRFNV